MGTQKKKNKATAYWALSVRQTRYLLCIIVINAEPCEVDTFWIFLLQMKKQE
jgi:hypothetical protein